MVNGNIYFYCTRLTLRFLTVSGIAVRSVFMAQTHLAKQDDCSWIVYYDTRCDHRCLLTLVTSLCLNVVWLLSYVIRAGGLHKVLPELEQSLLLF